MSNEQQNLPPVSSATAHEAAGKIGALPASIKGLDPSVRIYGPAFPVKCPAGDNLHLHHAIYAVQPGEVMVVDCGEGVEYGYWGEVMAIAAQQRGIAGLVTSGGVRDSQRMLAMGFPVFCGAIAIQGTGKNPSLPGSIGEPITFGRTTVRRGDWVIGDDDGVVVLPKERVEEILAKSRQRDEHEIEIFAQLRAGERTVDILGFPDLNK